MGVGKTNASTGTASAFSAVLQIATDANAHITAVNLAGDTFSGTANGSGDLNLTITQPGTYTVTETDGGVESIAIADNGETYQLTVIAFTGSVISDGTAIVSMTALAMDYSIYTGSAPTISTSSYGDTPLLVSTESGSYSGFYGTTNYFSLADYSYAKIRYYASGQVRLVAIDEDDQVTDIVRLSQESMPSSEITYSISSLDRTMKYRIGFVHVGSSAIRINNFFLQ